MQWAKRSLSASAVVASKANVSLSYSHSPSKFPMLGETFGQRLEWAVNKVPERDAFVFPKLNVRYTFAQSLQKVFMFITYLLYVYHVCIVFVLSKIVVLFLDISQADIVAAGLRALDIHRGTSVGLWGVNTPEWILSHAGALRAGALLANLHPGYRSAEIEYTLNMVLLFVLRFTSIMSIIRFYYFKFL